MKRLSFVVSSVLALACAGQGNVGAPLVRNPLVAKAVVSDPAPAPVLAAAEGPGHVFTPAAHPPHGPSAVPFVDVNRLPRMRQGGCFAPEPVTYSYPPRRSRTQASGRGTHGGVSGRAAAGGTVGGPRKPAPKASAPAGSPPAPASAPPGTEIGDAYGNSADGYSYGGNDSATGSANFKKEGERARPATPLPIEAEAPRAERKGDDRASVMARDEAPKEPLAYHDFGASIYLSNDDTMSLSSAQRVIFAIDKFLPIPREHIRPHELLNYFSFDTLPVAPTDDFSVHAGIEPKPGEPGVYTLGLSVSGRDVTKANRRNTALTFVVDRSGSMSDEGRMEYLKRGLLRMTGELKRGDLVNLVVFDHEACTPLENFVVGRDPMQALTGTIQKLSPRGSTDVDSGLRLGYSLADRGYQGTHSNRVVLVTDALANTGVTDPEMMAMISSHYDKRRIRLSGVGVGREFNDGLLDRLTERGKGAYVFLGSPNEVDAVFGERFASLVETIANDVHFKLELPPSLRMNVFYGEESSTVKRDVQAIHYFAGTSQLFLSDLMSKTPTLREEDSIMLTVEYQNPETGAPQAEQFAFNLGQIARGNNNLVKKGRLVMSFIDGLADTVASSPSRFDPRFGGWLDAQASAQCARGQASLADQARWFPNDAEVTRVVGLWDQYCARYEGSREPMRRTPPKGQDVWPSARR